MLINKYEEEAGREGREVEGNSHEYCTASELFDIMAKNHNFQDTGSDALTTSELVLLYKNIDLGTQLMTTAGHQLKKSNQYIETIVYNEENGSDESDVSEIYSNDDLHDVVRFNKDRIEMLNNPPSLENLLCQKFGDLKINTTDYSSPYDKYFLLKDPYVREQLNNMNNLNGNDLLKLDSTVLPSSLLDYICCRRLEDNYNFYMDNVIKYVQHTIEQLKRISNGDYLTEKVKEKWRERGDGKNLCEENFLCCSTSIPLQIERKMSEQANTWNEFMRSEIDVRSLSKLLEKKIVLQIPKLISASFTLSSKCCADKLVITCKKESSEVKDERLEVVLKLGKSQSGVITSKISSIMILQTSQPTERIENNTTKPLQIAYHPLSEPVLEEIVSENCDYSNSEELLSNLSIEGCDDSQYDRDGFSNSYQNFEKADNSDMSTTKTQDFIEGSIDDGEYGIPLVPTLSSLMKDMAPINISSPNELRLTVQKLNADECLPEESWEDMPIKKKSLGKVRIKSPYENKTFVFEEKKRKRLLDIRQRREMRKQAHLENLKMSKQKYGKPQSTNSVTSLSITNKSFYNSIYGQSTINASGKLKNCKWQKKDEVPKIILDLSADKNAPLVDSTDRDSKKYIDRSFYLDDTISDMMMRQKYEKEVKGDSCCTPSVNSNIVSQVIGDTDTALEFISDRIYDDQQLSVIGPPNLQNITDTLQAKLNSVKSTTVLVPSNSPKNFNSNNLRELKRTTTVEFKESIEKIYQLIKHVEQGPQENQSSHSKQSLDDLGGGESSLPASDSGTSAYHYIGSPVSSSMSLAQVNSNNHADLFKTLDTIMPISQKPTCTNRAQMARLDGEKFSNECKNKSNLKNSFDSKNPLKAISMLIREFDEVTKPKSAHAKSNKVKTSQSIHQNPHVTFRSPRRSPTRLDVRMSENVSSSQKNRRKVKDLKDTKVIKPTDKLLKKKMADIIDEAKEARGEAVRGPCVITSRLNSLAQPKKIYVQAHNDEQHLRAKRNYAGDRALKTTHHSRVAAAQENKNPVVTIARGRQKRVEAVTVLNKPPNVPPIVRLGKLVESASSSPEARRAGESTNKRRNIQDASEVTKKKMISPNAVKNDIDRSISPPEVKASRLRKPNNLKNVDSAFATSLQMQNKEQPHRGALNEMVQSLLKHNTFDLENLSECTEPGYVVSPDAVSLFDVVSKNGSSIYEMDVLGDVNVITAIENTNSKDTLNSKNESKTMSKIDEDSDHTTQERLQNNNSNISDSSLYKAFESGLFHYSQEQLTQKSVFKKTLLRQHKNCSLFHNLTLSPRHLDFKISKPEDVSVVKEMPVITNSKLDWNFPLFPVQIATVGFAFPQYNFMNNPANRTVSLAKLHDKDLMLSLDESIQSIITFDKTCQCCKNRLSPHKESKASSTIIVNFDTAGKFPIENHILYNMRKQDNPNETITSNELEFTDMQLEESNKNILDNNKDKTSSKFNDWAPIELNDTTEETSSLDMLVSVLNEIKNITTCQTNITNPFASPDNTDDDQTKKIDNFLENNFPKRETFDLFDPPSITIIKNCRKMDSNSSTDCRKHSKIDLNISLPLDEQIQVITDLVDKEVNANITNEIALISNTDVASQCFPLTVAHSTNITKSLVDVLIGPSITSMFPLDFYTISTDSFQTPKIVEQEFDDRVVIVQRIGVQKAIKEKKRINSSMRKDNVVAKIVNNAGIMGLKEDPTLKMKRDILVTVYSVLVFTVFAALSFPEVLYRI